MYASQSVSQRRHISLICFVLIFSLILSLSIPIEAAAASSYKVKSWKNDGVYYYYVYKGSLPKYYEPTFYRLPTDIYTASNGMKITIYSPYAPWVDVTEAQANAFIKYQNRKSSAKYHFAGWFGITQTDDWGKKKSYHPYKIEGWNTTRSLSRLLNAGYFSNSEGERIEVVKIGYGNVRSEKWDYIRNTLGCFTAFYWEKRNATVGLRYYDWFGDIDSDHYRW